jgi:site-specific DNA recombinase
VIRAAIYARVSTDEQAERYGLSSQVHDLRALAARKGYTVPAGAEFLDDGYSGAELDRPALGRLRDVVRAKAIDVVLIHDPDRLSRRLPHQLLLLDEFDRRGCRVEFVTTPREDTPEGRLLLNVKGIISEYEREKIRERTQRGKREKARRGLIVASYPYGYRPDPEAPGRLVVHEAEGEIVRLIYRLLVDEQRSTRAIVVELRRLGIQPARGRRWGPTSVRRILGSDRYTGRAYYNRDEVVENPKTGRKTRRAQRPASEWIAVPIPPIVTPERYAAAQAQLQRNREAQVGRPARFVYLLRGLLRCGACGTRYVGVPSHGRRYYRCLGRNRILSHGTCRSPWLSADIAEASVWGAMTDVLRDPATLLRKLEGYATRQGVRDVELRSGVEHLRRQLAEAERQERRLLDLYLEEALRTDALRERLQGLASRREGLRERLARAEAQATAHGALEARHDAIKRWCVQARRGIDRLNDKGRQQLLATLVDEITVLPDRSLEIHGLLPGRTTADTKLLQPA